MDVRRMQLWEGRNATVLANDAVRSVIEDQGGMVIELSNIAPQGGRINAHPLYWFRGKGMSMPSDENHDFWRNSTLLYHLGGNFFCFPNFGGGHRIGDVLHEPHGWTANGPWTVLKYGTDAETGANWLLSAMDSPEPSWRCHARKIDMVLPGHPVLYSSIAIHNAGTTELRATAAWHNTVGSPFLESGCVVDTSSKHYATAIEASEFDGTSRLVLGREFMDLSKAPGRNNSIIDLSVVPGIIGFTDFVTGAVPADATLGWSSVVNPRLKMVYLAFFTGPAALGEDDVPFYFNNLWMQYGGRPFTPWALYDGGTDQTFCLGVENSVGYFAEGLAKATKVGEWLGHPTTFVIPAGHTKVQRSGTAFAPFENPKMTAGVQTVEQVAEGLVLKHGKAWSFIDADSTFSQLRVLEQRLLAW